MRVHHFLSMVSALFLTACVCVASPSSTTTSLTLSPTQTPDLLLTRTPIPPPPTLPPALDFVEGLSEAPPGKHLFVEYWVTDAGESTLGLCPHAAMIDFPMYSGSSSRLDGEVSVRVPRSMPVGGIVGFFGDGDSHQGAMGGGAASELYAIETLPYWTPPYGQAIIHSVDAQGVIVAEVWGDVYRIEPGQSWVHIEESDPTPECHKVTTYRLKNYGLLDSSQVDVEIYYADEDFGIQSVGAPNKLDWFSDGERIVVGGEDGVSFYSTSPLTLTSHWPTPDPVHSVAISPDGQILASAGESIQLWDVSSGQPIGDTVGRSEAPWGSLAFSPDSKTLASGNGYGIIQLWNAATGVLIGRPWTDYLGQVRDLAFSADGHVLISSGGDRIIRLWNTETGEFERKMLSRGNDDFILATALSPEGTIIASGDSYSSYGRHDTIYLWEVSTGEIKESMRVESDQPWSLAFSPDGALLAAGFSGGRVVLWDLAKKEVSGRWSLGDYYTVISSLEFNADGTKLAAYRSDHYSEAERGVWVLDLETNRTAQIEHR